MIFPIPFIYRAPVPIFVIADYCHKNDHAKGYFSPRIINCAAIILLLIEILLLTGNIHCYYMRYSPAALFLCALAIISWMERGEIFTYRKFFVIFIIFTGLMLLNNNGICDIGNRYYQINNILDVITVLLPDLR